jgi:hypothetical protein
MYSTPSTPSPAFLKTSGNFRKIVGCVGNGGHEGKH